MTTIMLWPDVHREDGHWLPGVSLAQALASAGYNVKMMGIPDTKSIADLYNIPFTAVLADYFPPGYSQERLEKKKPQLAHYLPIADGALNAVFTGSGKPDLLVAGYFAALEALLVHHKYGVPLVTLTTFLRHPEATPALFAKRTLLDLPGAVVSKLLGQTTGNASMDLDTFIKPLDDATELIPMAREFDFNDSDWTPAGNVKYVEPMVRRIATGTAPAVDYVQPPPPPPTRLLYGACGSQVEVFESSARRFFTHLIEMMKGPGMDQRHLVLSLGYKLFPEFVQNYTNGGPRRLPPNVSLAPWVPQTEILQRADAVFLHGGLATIKESIMEGVPIVITPMVNDQFENALRIEQHDLGVLLKLERLSAENLRTALTEATSSPWFARAINAMKTLLNSREDAHPSVAIIKTIAPL